MGISSYTCAKTNLPILVFGETVYHGRDHNRVALFPGVGEALVVGRLGQYSRLETENGEIDFLRTGLLKKLDAGAAKLAICDYLDPGDGFETLGRSHVDPGQGGLTYGEEFIEEATRAGGFKSYMGLALAFRSGVPVSVAVDIDEEGVALYRAFIDRVVEGWERGTVSRLPGSPEVAIPGTIGKFHAVTARPLDPGCREIELESHGAPKQRFVFSGDGFLPDPASHVYGLAAGKRLGRMRSAVFEAADGRSYTVRTYGGDLYTVEGDGYPPKVFMQIDQALNTIGFDLPFPGALGDVDPEASEFFSPWGIEADRPESATFSIPPAGVSPRR